MTEFATAEDRGVSWPQGHTNWRVYMSPETVECGQRPETIFVQSSDISPNSKLPLLIYRNVFPRDADGIEQRLRANGWEPQWRDEKGFYPFDHFHSEGHELLAVVSGSVGARFGGPGGVSAKASAGDVIVLPAGTSHIAEFASDDLFIVGAYPPGQRPDIRRGKFEGDAEVLSNLAKLPLPATDPISGEKDGTLHALWSK